MTVPPRSAPTPRHMAGSRTGPFPGRQDLDAVRTSDERPRPPRQPRPATVRGAQAFTSSERGALRTSGRDLPACLGRAHEALRRDAIDLATVAGLPALGFGVSRGARHEVPTGVSHAADERVDGGRATAARAMGPKALPAALNGLGRLLDLWKPRQWAGRARRERQREDHRAPPPYLGSILTAHGSLRPSPSSRRGSLRNGGLTPLGTGPRYTIAFSGATPPLGDRTRSPDSAVDN